VSWNDLYLVVMVSIVMLVTGIGAWALLLVRCPACGTLHVIDTARCRRCGKGLKDPGEGPEGS